MIHHWKASRIPLRFSVTKKYTAFRNGSGQAVSDIYMRTALFDGHATDAATLIGEPAIHYLLHVGVPPAAISRWLGRVVYYGVADLGMVISQWSIQGSPDEVEEGRGLLGEGEEHLRRARIKQLLGIHERPANRFLSFDMENNAFAFDDLVARFDDTRRRAAGTSMIDASVLAENVRATFSGHLFRLERIKRR